MTVVTKQIGSAFLTIPSTYQLQWIHPQFSMAAVSRQGVAVGRSERTISDDVVKVAAFLRDVKYATAKQIEDGTGVPFSRMEQQLINNHFVNAFVMVDIPDPSEIKKDDALRVYTIDYASLYLLSIEGYDMTTWRWTNLLQSTTVVKKALVQTEIYSQMKRATVVDMRAYEQFREFRLGANSHNVDFFASFATRAETPQIFNFIGFVVEEGNEDLELRDRLENVESVFHGTKAGLKYFPNGEAEFPKLIVFVERTTQRNLTAAANTIGHVTSWSGANVAIVAMDDVHKNGLANATFYSIQTQEGADGGKSVKLGRINMPLFK